MGALRIVSQTIDEKIPVCLNCPHGIVFRAFCDALSSANFLPHSCEEKLRYSYASLIVDLGQAEEELLRSGIDQEGMVIYLSFGVSRFDLIKTKFPTAREFQYEGVIFPLKTPVSRLDEALRRAVFVGEMPVKNKECSPVWFEDVFSHIVSVLVSGKARASGVFSGEAETDFVTLANLCGRQRGVPNQQNTFVLPDLATGKSEKINSRTLEEIVQKIVDTYHSLAPETNNPKTSQQLRKHAGLVVKRKRRIKKLMIGAALTLGVLFSGVIVTTSRDSTLVLNSLQLLVENKELGGVGVANKALGRLATMTKLSDRLFSWMRSGKTHELGESLSVISLVLDGAKMAKQAESSLVNAYLAGMSGGGGDSLLYLKEAELFLGEAYTQFSQAQARLAQVETLLAPRVGGKAMQTSLSQFLPGLRKKIMTTRSLTQILPKLIGGDTQKAYAIALLDTTSIRSGGGRVVGVAILRFRQGKMVNSTVYKSQTLDKMITGAVTAPDEIVTYLHLPTWGIADSTWDASSRRVTERISWFLGKQLQQKVDGVVLLPTNMLPEFLKKTGEMKLSGSGTVVSQDNYKSTVLATLDKLPQNPTALEDFYNELFVSLLEKFKQRDTVLASSLMESLYDGFMEGNVVVGVGEPEAARVFATFAWDGNISTPACPQEFLATSCQVNGVYVVENNIGGNHSDAVLGRAQVHTILVGEDVNVHTRQITYTNPSSVLNWPLGTHQGLVKLFLDESSKIQSVSVGGKTLTPDKFTLISQNARLGVRILVEVPPASSLTVRVTYTTPGTPKTQSSLVFFEKKQAGKGDDPFTLVVTYPETYTPKTIAPRADLTRSSLLFTTTRKQNTLFGVGF